MAEDQSLAFTDVDAVQKRDFAQVSVDEWRDDAEFAETQPDSDIFRPVFQEEGHGIAFSVPMSFERCCHFVAQILDLQRDIVEYFS